MQEAVLPLATWQNFYVITGSAAATLTGLMFVVISLIVGTRARVSPASGGIAAFSTPRRYGNGGSGQSNKGSTLLFSKLYVSYSGILVLLADASMLDKQALSMQGVLIS